MKKILILSILAILMFIPLSTNARDQELVEPSFNRCGVWKEYKFDSPICGGGYLHCYYKDGILARTQKTYRRRNCLTSSGKTITQYDTYHKRIGCCD